MSLEKREKSDRRPGFGHEEESDVIQLVREGRKGLFDILFSRLRCNNFAKLSHNCLLLLTDVVE